MATFNIQGARSQVPTPNKTQITEEAAIASGTAKLAAVSRSPAVRRRCYSLAEQQELDCIEAERGWEIATMAIASG